MSDDPRDRAVPGAHPDIRIDAPMFLARYREREAARALDIDGDELVDASDESLQGSYQPYTHAFLPQDHFDEVVSSGRWTFARSGGEYLALYSWRTPEWVTYDPAVVDTNGMTRPFELVAPGGPNNVWITELGSEATNGSFDRFRSSIESVEPVITPLGDPGAYSTGFDVEWTSPTEGRITFGWDRPLVVDGNEVPISGYPRIDSPWADVPFDSTSYEIRAGDHSLSLDVPGPTRRSSGDA